MRRRSLPAVPFTRSEAPAGGSEKSGGLRVSHDLVAVVPISVPGISIPTEGFLTLRVRAALQLAFEVLMVCENLEPMLNLARYSQLDGFMKARPALVLFRGAPGLYRTEVASDMVKCDQRPCSHFLISTRRGSRWRPPYRVARRFACRG